MCIRDSLIAVTHRIMIFRQPGVQIGIPFLNTEVTHISPTSPADISGLEIGYQILEVNQEKVFHDAEIRKQIPSFAGSVTFGVNRIGMFKLVMVRVFRNIILQ